MHKAKIRSWLTGGAIIALIIFVGAWFLMISPVRAETAELEEQAEAQEDINLAEAKRIAVLKAQFEQIDEFKEDLSGLRTHLPQTPEHSEFQRQLAELAEDNDVAISGISVSASGEVLGASIAPPTPAEGEEAATGADGEAAPAPAPRNQFQDFYQVPVTIEVQGSYRNAMDFVQDLQTDNPRLFLVVGLNGNAMEASEESGGLPARSDGDLELVISGQMYVMADGEAVTWTEEDFEFEVPKPKKGTNPMVGG